MIVIKTLQEATLSKIFIKPNCCNYRCDYSLICGGALALSLIVMFLILKARHLKLCVTTLSLKLSYILILFTLLIPFTAIYHVPTTSPVENDLRRIKSFIDDISFMLDKKLNNDIVNDYNLNDIKIESILAHLPAGQSNALPLLS